MFIAGYSQIIYNIISTMGILYFLFKKRIFDFFSLAFFGSYIYFIPAVFGFVIKPSQMGFQKVVINNEVYYIYIIILTIFLFGAIIFDLTNKKSYKTIIFKFTNISSQSIYYSMLIISFVTLILFLVTNSNEIVSSGKPSFNRFHHMFTLTFSLLILNTFYKQKYKSGMFFLMILLIDVYGGNREAFATVFLSLLVLISIKKFRYIRIGKKISFWIISLTSGMFLFLYKGLYRSILNQNYNIVISKLTSFDYYIDSIMMSEPFITQMILNETVINDFSIGKDYINSIISFIVPLSNYLFNVEMYNFSHEFTNKFFPFIDFGLASNIWAELYSLLGILLILFFSLINVIFLFLGSKFIIASENGFLNSLLTLMFSYWFFFMNRTGLLYQLTIQRRIIFWGISILLFSFIIEIIFKNHFSK